MLSTETVLGHNGKHVLQHHKEGWAFLPLLTVLNVFTLRYALTTAKKTFLLHLLSNERVMHLLPTILFGKYTVPLNVSPSYHQQETKTIRVTTAALHTTQC